MYAKFPYYSVAQIYAFNLDQPVSILLGGDNLYWVVEQSATKDYLEDGTAMLLSMPYARNR